MATHIVDKCINCGACVAECPNEAITRGPELYEINPERCSECVGFYSAEACQAICPVECCLPDPNRREGESELLARARLLHPSRLFAEPVPSRFRRGTL